MNNAQQILIDNKHLFKLQSTSVDNWTFKDFINGLCEITELNINICCVDNETFTNFCNDVEHRLGKFEFFKIIDLYFSSDESCDAYTLFIGDIPFALWCKVGDRSDYKEDLQFFDLRIFNTLKEMMFTHFSEDGEDEHYNYYDGGESKSILDLIKPVNNYVSTKVDDDNRFYYQIASPYWCCNVRNVLNNATLLKHDNKKIDKWDNFKGVTGSYTSNESEYPRIDVWYEDCDEPVNVLVSEIWICD